MTDTSGEITVEVDREDINKLMDNGTVRIRLAQGPVSVYARCTESLQFEVVADE